MRDVFWIPPDQLHHHQRQAHTDCGAAHHIRSALGEFGASDHFCGHIGRRESAGRAAKWQVRNAGHRSDPDTTRHGHITDLHRIAYFLGSHHAAFLGILCGAVKLE